MQLRDLFESPDQDVAMADQASRVARAILSAIYADAEPEHFVEFGKHGDFYIYDAVKLGLADLVPQADTLCVMIGQKQASAFGRSGGIWTFDEGLLGRYQRGLVLHAVRGDLTDDKVRAAVNSTESLSILRHESMHLLDFSRFDQRAFGRVSDPSNKAAYYNDPAEFNAFYHDLCNSLTNILGEAKDGASVKDLADLYGFTGEFATDLKHMIGQTPHTGSFWKWLNTGRRQALLRRLYKLHQHVVQALDQHADQAA